MNNPHLNLNANKAGNDGGGREKSIHYALPDEWRKIADETERALSVARAIENKNYPAGGSDSPPGLLPALLVSVSLARVRDACLAVADQGGTGVSPALIENLAAIESELCGLSAIASDAFYWLTDPKRGEVAAC